MREIEDNRGIAEILCQKNKKMESVGDSIRGWEKEGVKEEGRWEREEGRVKREGTNRESGH